MSNPAPGFASHAGYQVRFEAPDSRLTVRVGDAVVARSERPLQLIESRHAPVWYVPMADIRQELITTSDTSTYCPFKGHASYWSIVTRHGQVEDAIWAYLEPYDECQPIRGYAAFYTDRVALTVSDQ